MLLPRVCDSLHQASIVWSFLPLLVSALDKITRGQAQSLLNFEHEPVQTPSAPSPTNRLVRDAATLSSDAAFVEPPGVQSPRRRHDTLSVASHLTPASLWYVLLFFAPLLLLLRTSFAVVRNYHLQYAWSLKAYSELFTDPLTRQLLGRTLLLALVVTICCFLLGFPAAWFLSRQSPRVRTILLVLILVPWWSSYIVRVLGWQMAFGYGGVFNSLVRELGLGQGVGLFGFGWFAIALAETNLYLPLMIVPVYLTLERLDYDAVLAALSLGAKPSRVLARVILPLAAPGITTGVVFVFMPVTGEFLVPQLVGGPSNILYGNQIQTQFGNAFNWPYGSSLAILLLAVLLVLLTGVRFLSTHLTRHLPQG